MTDEARLQRWREAQGEGGHSAASAHVDVETLVRYSTGRLSGADARAVARHLDVCDDGCCAEYIREQGGDPNNMSSDWVRTSDAASSEAFRARTFRSREIVWSTFESMARELEIPIDDLVNEAMVAFAENRGYALGGGAPSRPNRKAAPVFDEDDDLARTINRFSYPGAPGMPESRTAAYKRGDAARPPADRPPMPKPPPPRAPPARPASSVAPPERRAPPPPDRSLPPPRVPPPAPSARSRVPTNAPSVRPPSTHRLPESHDRSPAPASVRTLVLEYGGRTYPVEKERFLIGRSKTQSDLRLDDPNVSRQHAVIERVGAAWYIVDLGSTNGVLIAGERVARRALMDTDLITITTHEIRCSFRPR